VPTNQQIRFQPHNNKNNNNVKCVSIARTFSRKSMHPSPAMFILNRCASQIMTIFILLSLEDRAAGDREVTDVKRLRRRLLSRLTTSNTIFLYF